MNNSPTPARKLPESLEGARFTLKPFNEEDISPQYIGWLNDPTVNRFLEVRFTHQTFETVLHYVRGFYQEEEKYMWGIYSNDTDKPIGTATLSAINRIHGSTEGPGAVAYLAQQPPHSGTIHVY
jgi:RimJ/RimL family protein N-acetyltransferase